jgi:uncharacterized membrane protein
VANSKRKRPAQRRRQDSQRHTATRTEKRRQFSDVRRRSPFAWIAPVVVLVAIVAIAAVVIVSNSQKNGSAQAASIASGGPATGGGGSAVTIPVSQVSDGNVHFFSTTVGGTTVKYFVVKAPDGSLRTAFNACDVCFPYKKGYRQQSAGVVQCNNCGRVFTAASIDVQRGGCNPGPISAKVVGNNLVIPAGQLQSGVRFF